MVLYPIGNDRHNCVSFSCLFPIYAYLIADEPRSIFLMTIVDWLPAKVSFQAD